MLNDYNQIYKLPIMDVIRKRISLRTYQAKELSMELREELLDYARRIKGPFEPKVRLVLIDNASIAEKTGGKIGTYGIIKGAQHYIAAIVEQSDKSYEQLGYVLEKLVLFAASMDLGTCWLGGTFRKSDFAKIIPLKKTEEMPIVSPIGYPNSKKSMIESFMRFSVNSNKRKPWEELFFHHSFHQPLEKKLPFEFLTALEGVRLAPSSSNTQPWRIVRQGDTYHFYLMPHGKYRKSQNYKFHRIDLGIAMCHFELVLFEHGIHGNWHSESVDIEGASNDLLYIISWRKAD